MTASHTPGPWTYWPKSAYPDGVISQDATTTHIAVPVFHPDVNRTTANARLIAAAPDLLEALKTLQRQALQGNVRGDEWMDEALELTRAAIAKAKGA